MVLTCCNWTLRGLRREVWRGAIKPYKSYLFSPLSLLLFKIHTALSWKRQVEKSVGTEWRDLTFPKVLNFASKCSNETCPRVCSVRQSDGWRKYVPGLCFMKVEGPKGWSGKHIISVQLLGWMNESFIIKHLRESLELLWTLVDIKHSSRHMSSFFGHEMKMLLYHLSLKEKLSLLSTDV